MSFLPPARFRETAAADAVGSRYPIQVGGRDFALDLLFFNRALNCLVAIELKVIEFEPEHLGKLQFYLEALDRDVKKPHEQPSIGVLLSNYQDQADMTGAISIMIVILVLGIVVDTIFTRADIVIRRRRGMLDPAPAAAAAGLPALGWGWIPWVRS